MKKFKLFILTILVCMISLSCLSTSAFAIGPVSYQNDYFPDKPQALEKHYPPIKIVEDAVDYVNNIPYFNLNNEPFDVKLVTQYGTTASIGGAIHIYSNEYYETNVGKKLLIPGCIYEDRNKCIINRYIMHEVGHYIDDRYLSDAECLAMAKVFNAGSDMYNNYLKSKNEFIANAFYNTFGDPSSHYLIQDLGINEFCSYETNYKPYVYTYAFYMAYKYDLKNPNFSNVEKRKKCDVDNNGKIDQKDVDLANSLININIDDNNIGQYWSSDMDYDNHITSNDIELIKKSIPPQEQIFNIGDINKDNKIDSTDFTIFVSSWNKKVKDRGWNQKINAVKNSPFNRCDFNNDNKVDFDDLKIFVQKWEDFNK